MTETKQNAATLSQVDQSIAAEFAWEFEEDRKNYKIALFIAILVHIFLIWWQMPDMGGQEFVVDEKEERIMRRVILRPPPEQALQQVQLQQKVQKVPVPDPTPDEPEPIVPIETNENDQELNMDVDDYIIGIPDRPPVPTGPVREGVAGLERPVYDLAQLQSNVIYPELGKKAGMQGFVILEVILQKDGTVGNVKVLGGNLRSLGFPEAASRACKKLRFTPGKLRGQPVDVIMTLNVQFQLSR